MSRAEWKESGKDMGHAWSNFGKTVVRSAKTTTGKVGDWADGKKEDPENPPEPNSTVYSDGSWKNVGKELGGAFAGMGKTLLHTVGIGGQSNAGATPPPPSASKSQAEAKAQPVSGAQPTVKPQPEANAQPSVTIQPAPLPEPKEGEPPMAFPLPLINPEPAKEEEEQN